MLKLHALPLEQIDPALAPFQAEFAQKAGLLPPFAHGGLELALTDHGGVDVSCQVLQPSSAEVMEWALANRWDLPGWDAFCGFLQGWTQPSLSAIPMIWLERDGDPRLPPSLFFSPRADLLTAQALANTTPEAFALAQAALAHLAPDATIPSSLATFGVLHQVGVMLSRTVQAHRLCFEQVTWAMAPELLRVAGHDPDASGAADMIAWLSALNARLSMLDFDIGPDRSPRVGLEVSFEGVADAVDHWAVFLEHLERLGLADADRRVLVQNWRGRRMISLDAEEADYPVWLGISHIKLTVAPQLSPSAKAYLAFSRNTY